MAAVASHVPFNDLCSLCERICKKKGKQKQIPLQDFITKWREFHRKLHENNPNTTDSFFPALRLLLPQCERERAAYGIKEITLAKLYISIFCLGKNSVDAQKLLNFRSPKTAKEEAGDFASVAYYVLKKRCPEKGILKIQDINSVLDKISTNNAGKNKEEVKANLLYLLQNTTALEQKWLIRMILKDMKLGTSEQTVLKTFHSDGPDLYNVTNSLEKVCIQLKNPAISLHEIEISLFTPFRPMLGEQALPQQVVKLMQNQPFVIEIKYDGERVQIHKQGNMYKYFSRGGHDQTHVYGGSPLEGKLTPHIANCFKPKVSNCILDGEMVIYSTKLNCIVSKGENADIQALEPDGDYGPCFCVYDVLMVNDKVLSNLPLCERVTYMRDILTPIENRIRLTEQQEAEATEHVVSALNKAIDNREEGIVIKNPMSKYRPNARKGGGWLKVKPDYIDNLMDELDLLIIGGNFGEGRRANMISHFLLAVAKPPDSPGDEPKVFLSVAKVGSGYSLKELHELLGALSTHWQVYNPKSPPKHVIIGGGRKEKPDVWIEPSKSRIVQVRAAEIVKSDKFSTNCTLRFPRVEKIRYDKLWHECMTTEELETMRKQSDGKLANKHHVDLSEEEPSPKKARQSRVERVFSVAPHFRPADVSDVQKVSEMLKDKEICVHSTSSQTKQLLEKKIVEFGGKFVQNPGTGTFCVVADKVTAKVQNIINTNMYDVIRAEWLMSCFEKKSLLSWVPEDILHGTKSTLAKLHDKFDEYGDSFSEAVTEFSLQKIFDNVPLEDWEPLNLTTKEIANLEYHYFSELPVYGLFRTCRVYMDDKLFIGDCTTQIPDSKLQLTALKLRLYGGNIVATIDDETTHVIMYSGDTLRLQELQTVAKQRHTGLFYIITEKWVDESIKAKRSLQEIQYQPS